MAGIFGKAKRGFGKALRPRGPGVIRPKPTDRYGQTLKPKPIRPGKKDGGKIVGDYVEKKRSEFKSKRKLKPVKPSQKGLQSLPRDVRNKMGYMKKGGKVKKFPDLTGDGKVTRADILKGRGVFASGGRPGLYANIHAKRRRGGKMRKKGAKGAPTAANFARAKQTARN